MKEVMADIAAFQGRTRAVRAQPLSERMPAAKALADEACQPPTTAPIALAAIRSVGFIDVRRVTLDRFEDGLKACHLSTGI
jgi:hypothetical protein